MDHKMRSSHLTDHNYCITSGYGSAGAGRKVDPDDMFRIASISKTITAVGIMRLVQDGKLTLEDKVFGSQGILNEYSPTVNGDRRIVNITVRHLLQHSSGWDRDRAGDPVFWKVGKHMNVEEPVTAKVLIQYMMGKKLQFAPGKRHAYSNLGFTVLGQVIERSTGQSYEEFMLGILKSVAIEKMKIGRTRKKDLCSGEVEYFHDRHPRLVRSIFSGGGRVPPQYGRWTIEEADAHGGWIATAADLLKFLHALEHGISGRRMISPEMFKLMLEKPSFEHENSEEWYGFGLDIRDSGKTWGHSGQMEGTSGVLTHHCGGYAWALLFNSWAKDLDLDGLVKYALSRAAHSARQQFACDVSPNSLHSLALRCDNKDSSNEISVNPEMISTADSRQLIKIMVPVGQFWPLYEGLKQEGFELTWLHAINVSDDLFFNTIFFKRIENSVVYIGLTANSCRECLEGHPSLRPVHLETYVQNDEFLYAVLLTPSSGKTWAINYDLTVAQHRKNMPVMFQKGYNLTVQCLTEFRGRLHVSAIYEKAPDGECVAEFDLKPDYYLFEFNKQAKQGATLSYVRAYHVKGQPRFSVIWTNRIAELSGTRHNVSKYGFLFELGEAAKNDFYVRCISCYLNEGVVNFVASWMK
ncbi:uncharacterized protein [Montipora foliosa]|uniref:uncharacterized protein isoform X2 n=1 Tax=Montipora foliosa TaxID=591990 RepID=UPI0035F20C60